MIALAPRKNTETIKLGVTAKRRFCFFVGVGRPVWRRPKDFIPMKEEVDQDRVLRQKWGGGDTPRASASQNQRRNPGKEDQNVAPRPIRNRKKWKKFDRPQNPSLGSSGKKRGTQGKNAEVRLKEKGRVIVGTTMEQWKRNTPKHIKKLCGDQEGGQNSRPQKGKRCE